MADESVDTAPTGLPSSVEESNADWGALFQSNENQSIMEQVENDILYANLDDDASVADAADDTSTPDEVAAPEDESGTEEPEKEEPAEEEAEEAEPEEVEEQEPEPETPEQELARLREENESLRKRVSGASRKATYENDKVAQLEAKLQRLEVDKVEAERQAKLKPYHFGHPEHAAYQEKKIRVDAWNRMRSRYNDSEEDRQKVDLALIDLGLTTEDIQLVRDGNVYEADQARRFATDPNYRRQVMAQDYQAVMAEEQAKQRQQAQWMQLLEDKDNQRLMNDVYKDEFDSLWNAGHNLPMIFERLHRLDAEDKLKAATAAKNRVQASKQTKSDLAKKKAAVSTETKPAPEAGPLWASDLADKAVEEYENQTGRRFVPDRRDCQEFFNEYCRGKIINTEERK